MLAYKAVPRPYDIEGAPFRIGLAVKVTMVIDETLDDSWVGQVGEIVYYEYDCGCSQTFPHDPMIGVKFPSGRTEEFWTEELIEFAESNST